ncbi:MAG TPA: prolipoprotein diacylglyceryl transferase family protein, partial [Patescibacteria group bacterium]|nr:prolipoprotein diacylglyceryl transferase family protein [Patescibacteria group bacterium]
MVDLVNLLRSVAFGPFIALGFLCGAFVFWKKGKEEYYDEYALFDVLLASSFWGLLGARAGFILAHIQDFGVDIVKWLSVFTYPGYVGLAGFVAGTYVLFSYAKKQHWDAFELADFGAMGLSLASVLFATGMFVNGSGFGNPTTLPMGMQFPGVFDNRHPSQLYAAVLYLVLFII